MGMIGGDLGFWCLQTIARRRAQRFPEQAPSYIGRSKLEVLLGQGVWDEIAGRDVLDFGCGPGAEAVEMAQHGARVIGIDLREKWLGEARARAAAAGVADRCVFAKTWQEPVDVILSLDSFEHYADPAAILKMMHGLLKPNGRVLVSFGPPWFHPLGGHLYSTVPVCAPAVHRIGAGALARDVQDGWRADDCGDRIEPDERAPVHPVGRGEPVQVRELRGRADSEAEADCDPRDPRVHDVGRQVPARLPRGGGACRRAGLTPALLPPFIQASRIACRSGQTIRGVTIGPSRGARLPPGASEARRWPRDGPHPSCFLLAASLPAIWRRPCRTHGHGVTS